MSNLIEISSNLGSYLASVRPQIKDDVLIYYFAGSLATMITASAESISEIILDDNNNIIGEQEPKIITLEQKKKMEKFSRKLGFDIDIVNVNGNFYEKVEKTPSMSRIRENVENVSELMSWNPDTNGTGYVDNLDYERQIKHHSVVRVKTKNGNVYVTAPPDMLAHKFHELLVLKEMSNTNISHYTKDIRDFSTMFYGYKDLYSMEELSTRVYKALNEKGGSIFNLNNAENLKKSYNDLARLAIAIRNDAKDFLDNEIGNDVSTDLINFINSIFIRKKNELFNQLGNSQKTEDDGISR